MKRQIIAYCFICLAIATISAQKQLPEARLETLKGETVNTSSLLRDSIPVVISFWSTVCKPCLRELDAFTEHFEKWQEEVQFKIVAVSIDDARSSAKVRGLVSANEWPVSVLLDKNQNFKRAMNVHVIPHLYVVDKKGNIVYSRIGYTPGGEAEVLDVLKGLR